MLFAFLHQILPVEWHTRTRNRVPLEALPDHRRPLQTNSSVWKGIPTQHGRLGDNFWPWCPKLSADSSIQNGPLNSSIPLAQTNVPSISSTISSAQASRPIDLSLDMLDSSSPPDFTLGPLERLRRFRQCAMHDMAVRLESIEVTYGDMLPRLEPLGWPPPVTRRLEYMAGKDCWACD